MTDVDQCQEDSCTHSQNAVCLHCDQRLCFEHISAHNESLLNESNTISDDLNALLEQINLKCQNETKVIAAEQLKQWLATSLESIEREYNEKLQMIHQLDKSLHETLEEFKETLYQRINEIRIPLERIHSKLTTSKPEIDRLHQSVERIREEVNNLEYRIVLTSKPIDFSHYLKVCEVWKQQKSDNKPVSTFIDRPVTKYTTQTPNSPIPKIKELAQTAAVKQQKPVIYYKPAPTVTTNNNYQRQCFSRGNHYQEDDGNNKHYDQETHQQAYKYIDPAEQQSFNSRHQSIQDYRYPQAVSYNTQRRPMPFNRMYSSAFSFSS
ncbi:unnamed protein product [Didymodactylos carnosus]|uniref:Uncharacterized protein n=1 Tax=Didymodactylos carnosus TaxID=1234261 RepID=A0A815L5X9_9BILA|nr:unnamed protein product [Didymodactylos carnosus]CAF1434134.1 unnamed protein product [Didymodactylos carnosus]CAF4231737.1 unnamed protein product [Didymodactylos carnosus]CAF4296758.1 unnamed protein product [Didymodactylos carnosus]